MTALVWPRAQLAPANVQPWRRCVAVSDGHRCAGRVGDAPRGGHGVVLARRSHRVGRRGGHVEPGQLDCPSGPGARRKLAPGRKASPAVPAVALGLSVAAAAVARVLGGPPVMVLGCVDVVVANVVVAVSAALAAQR